MTAKNNQNNYSEEKGRTSKTHEASVVEMSTHKRKKSLTISCVDEFFWEMIIILLIRESSFCVLVSLFLKRCRILSINKIREENEHRVL